jgi:hypothetical protein
MSSPDSFVGQEETCPECGNRTNVPQEGISPPRSTVSAISGNEKKPSSEPVFQQTRTTFAEPDSGKAPLVPKVLTLVAYAVAAAGLAFGNYTYHAWGASHDRSGDRYGFVGWTLVGVIYVLGSFFSRWVAIGSCVVAVLGFFMFITYPVSMSFSWFWGQTLAMATYVVAFIGSITIIVTGQRKIPDPDAKPGCKTSALAVLSLIFSCIPYPVTTIPGVILGHLARRQIRKHSDTKKGLRLAAGGLFLGYAFLGISALLIVVLIVAKTWASGT